MRKTLSRLLYWFYGLLAFLGGRSLAEAAHSEPEEMEASIAIGLAMLASFAIVVTGQTLFLNSIPAFEPHASLGGWLLGLLFLIIYRLIVRALEVAISVGKLLLLLVGTVFAGVNTLMASHEVVLKVFEPQVSEQVVLKGNRSVDDYQQAMDKRLGLGALGSTHQSLDERVTELRQALLTRDPKAEQFAQQAGTCRSQASRQLANLPDRESDRYQRSLQVLREKRRDCTRLEADGMAAQRAHVARTETELKAVEDERRAIKTRLERARTTLDSEMAEKAPVLRQSAEQGFARHPALWEAVKAGSVPGWAVVGLMAATLLLEGLAVLLKVAFRLDPAALERKLVAQDVHEELFLKQAYGNVFHHHARDQVEKKAMEDAQGTAGQELASVVGHEWTTQSAARNYERARKRVFQAYDARPPRSRASRAPSDRPDREPHLPQPHRMMGAMTRLHEGMRSLMQRREQSASSH